MSTPSDDTSSADRHDRVFPLLAGAVDGGTVLSLAEQAHVEHCLACQAELMRYRRMLRALHELRTTVIRPAPGLLSDILDNLGEKAEQHVIHSLITGRRIAYAGGIAVAAAAGVTGVVLLTGRSKALKLKGAKKAA